MRLATLVAARSSVDKKGLVVIGEEDAEGSVGNGGAKRKKRKRGEGEKWDKPQGPAGPFRRPVNMVPPKTTMMIPTAHAPPPPRTSTRADSSYLPKLGDDYLVEARAMVECEDGSLKAVRPIEGLELTHRLVTAAIDYVRKDICTDFKLFEKENRR